MEETQKATEALEWIVGILQKHNIPFQLTGGIAAKAYGATRPLNDIDIDVPNDRIKDLLPDVKDYVIFGPARYKDDDWDLLLLTLNYKGQDIDIGGGDDDKVFDKAEGTWFPVGADLSVADTCEVLGLMVPVMSPHTLMDYKRRLSRTVDGEPIDLDDVAAIKEYLRS